MTGGCAAEGDVAAGVWVEGVGVCATGETTGGGGGGVAPRRQTKNPAPPTTTSAATPMRTPRVVEEPAEPPTLVADSIGRVLPGAGETNGIAGDRGAGGVTSRDRRGLRSPIVTSTPLSPIEGAVRDFA